jgi:hypothetical protein
MIQLIRVVIVTLFAISLLSFLSKPKAENYAKNLGHPWEEYDSGYFKRFQTVKSIIDYADAAPKAGKKNSLQYYNLVAETLRKRFYHGYSYYNFSDNPLAYLTGQYSWSHLSAIVIPDDILKHPMAACSQQSLVLIEIFKRNKISYRKIAFNGHFALEGFIDNQWRFFDTNMEPSLSSARKSVDALETKGNIYLAYANTGLGLGYLQHVLGKPIHGSVNETLALKAKIFHQVCFLLVSKWFLLGVLILTFWADVKMKVVKKFFCNKKQLSFSLLQNNEAA